MAVTVVGSIAFDAVKTPFGERERMLGGAAVHFALAASFFDEVRVVGPVGDDFGEAELGRAARAAASTSPTSSTSPAARRSSGQGEYGWDLNTRETLRDAASASSSTSSRSSRPRRARASCCSSPTSSRTSSARCARSARARSFAALDSMNLWIEIARDSLVATIAGVDCLVLNDAELRQLTEQAEPDHRRPRGALVGAARADRDHRQAGRVRRGADHRRRASSRCRRSRSRTSSTRPAPATPSPAASSATSRRQPPTGARTASVLRQAMAYGTALASFNVEEFGTERVARLTGAEITARVARAGADHALQRRADRAARLSRRAITR